MSIIRDPAGAEYGRMKIRWVQDFMPALSAIRARFAREQPFAGMKITMSIHLEAKTAYLALCLKDGGAEVHATGCNPLSTQDDVAAGLASLGVNVYAWHGATPEEYHAHLTAALACRPDLLIDDGGDLLELLCSTHTELADRLIGLGVRGFWNFTNVELSTKEDGVFFEDIHFVDTLLTLSYRISQP